MPLGLDSKSVLVGLALGFFVAPMVVGRVRSKLTPAK
jgi:hypothetical protein